jgi:hypothetical protein
LAYFEACQAKTPVRGWCKLNISRVRGWCGSVKLKYFFGAADWTQVCTVYMALTNPNLAFTLRVARCTAPANPTL